MSSMSPLSRSWSSARPGLLVQVEPVPGESEQGFWLREAARNGLNPRWTRSATTLGFHARARLCPSCLRDGGIWRVEWLTSDCFLCLTHGLWLADKCDSCRQDLRWSNVRYQHCQCGRSLELVRQEPLPFAAAGAAEGFPREVLDLVGSLSIHGLGNKPGKKASRVDVASVAARTAAGVAVLRHFQAAMPALLDRIRVPPPAPGTVQLLNEAFPALKRRMDAVCDGPWRERLTGSLDEFVANSTATANPIVGRNTAPVLSPMATVARLATSLGVAPTRMARTLDRLPASAVARRVTTGGRVRRVVIGERPEELSDALMPSMSCRAVGRRLGLSARRTSVLKSEGVLAPMSQAGVQVLLRSLPGEQAGMPDDAMPISAALRSLIPVARTGDLLRALLTRRVGCWCRRDVDLSVASLADWHVSDNQVRVWSSQSLEDAVTVPEVAQAVGVKQEVAYHLVRCGLLAATFRRGPARRERVVDRAEIERFGRRYALLSKLAGAVGVGARGAVAWAEQQGHRIVCGPTVDGCRQYVVEKSDGINVDSD
jgi:hypothetical protein